MAKKKNGNGNSTALATIDVNMFPALVPGSEVKEAMDANLCGETMTEANLTAVPTPAGGATNWIIPGLTGEEINEEIRGVLVVYRARGTLWPNEDPVEGCLPVLVSHDLRTAHKVGDDLGDLDPKLLEAVRAPDGSYDWQRLAYNKWGSGKDGWGFRCKNSRLMLILREGEAFPLLVRCQPGSVPNMISFMKQLVVPHWRAVISLKLKKVKNKRGQTYSQLVPSLVGILDPELGELVRKTYTDTFADVVSASPDYEQNGS